MAWCILTVELSCCFGLVCWLNGRVWGIDRNHMNWICQAEYIVFWLMFHLCLIICMWNLAMWRTSNPILNPSDSVAFSQIHIRRICSRVLHETSYIQSHSRPFPQTAVPLPRSSVPLPSRSRWCESRSREHIFLSGRIPTLLCMPCITACVKQTPGRAWYLTRGTLCYQRSRGEMLSLAAGSSLTDIPHIVMWRSQRRQTTLWHCW